MSQLKFRGIALLGSLVLFAALSACSTPNNPSPNQPLIGGVSPSPSTVPSNASGTIQPGADATSFFDDFTGNSLDSTRWLAFPQTGLIAVHDGVLDVSNAGAQPNFPYVVTKDVIIPQSGPFYFETTFTCMAAGALPSICLDYLPATAPNDPPLTQPFMAMSAIGSNFGLFFNTEKGVKSFAIPNSSTLRVAHRIRVENDGQGNYRVIGDHTQIGSFYSEHRPMKFWVGHNPPADVGPGQWARYTLDYVKTGVLTSPDPATPMQAATPAPGASGTAAAKT